MRIYKLLRPSEYAVLRAEGSLEGAPVDLADGFVHLSTAEQLEQTARRHFADVDRMWVLGLDADALGEALKWEPSRGGALFPHLYAPLQRTDVTWEAEVTRDADAEWDLPASELG